MGPLTKDSVKPRARATFVLAATLVLLCGTQSAGAQTTARGKVRDEVFHWGGFFGTHPIRYQDTLLSPTAIKVHGTVKEVATSNSTQYALLSDGEVYAWGQGVDGELGDGKNHNSFERAVKVKFPRGVKIAYLPTDAMPYDTALAVDTKGRAWGWGLNYAGELCLGNSHPHPVPIPLPLSGVTALAGAGDHALFDSHGTVFACGTNQNGDLGDGSTVKSQVPVRVKALSHKSVKVLVAAFNNSGALLANGEYFDWGLNDHGQLGDGKRGGWSSRPVHVKLPGPVIQVVQGGSYGNNGSTLVMLHSVANGARLVAQRALWSWGAGSYGQLGDLKTSDQSSPVQFSAPRGVTYRSLAAGGATSYAISTTGYVYAWGDNAEGQVGDGTKTTAVNPVSVESGVSQISATADNVDTAATRRAP